MKRRESLKQAIQAQAALTPEMPLAEYVQRWIKKPRVTRLIKIVDEDRILEVAGRVPALSRRKIAEECGVTVHDVLRVLLANRMATSRAKRGPPVGTRTTMRNAALIDAALRGQTPTLAELGTQFGVTKERVRQILKAHDVIKPMSSHQRAVLDLRAAAKKERDRAAADQKATRSSARLDRMRIIKRMKESGATWREIGIALFNPTPLYPSQYAYNFAKRYSHRMDAL